MDLWNQLVPDARRIANWYNRFGQHDWYELHSATLFGLVQGIRWVEDGRCEHDNHVAYVLTTMHRFVREHIREDHLIKVPHQEATRYMKADEQYKIPLVFTATQGIVKTTFEICNDDGHVTSERTKNPINLRNTEHHQMLDFEDFCNLFTDKERQVVDWLMCKYTYREMGAMWNVSAMTINRIVDRIKIKLKGEFDYKNLRKDSNVSTNEAGR